MRGHRMDIKRPMRIRRLLFVVPAVLCLLGLNKQLQEEEENAYRTEMKNLRGHVYASNVTYQLLPPVQVLDVSMFRLWKKLQENGSSLDILFQSAKKYQIQETDGVLIPCQNCWPETTKPCPVPGMLWWIIDKQVPAVYPDRAVHTVPRGFALKTSDIQGAGKGVFTLQDIPPCTIIGPHWGKLLSFQELRFVNQRDYLWEVPAAYPNRAVHTVPQGFEVKSSNTPGAGNGVFTHRDLPPCTIIGPYWGILLLYQEFRFVKQQDYAWQLSNGTYRDAYNETISNWLRYINCPNYEYEQNVVPEEYDGEIFYRTVDQIPAGKELLAWYGDAYGKRLRQRHVTKNVIFKPRSQK